MKRFLKNAAIYIFPFIILFGLPFLAFVKAGEFISVSKVISLQKNLKNTVLFGRVYTDSRQDKNYKVKATLARRPEVLMVGTSRVLGYRSVFFSSPGVFYNAGRSITQIDDLNKLLDQISVSQNPKIIIVGLDQNLFFDESQPANNNYSNDGTLTTFFTYNWRMVYKDYFNHKFKISDLFKHVVNLQPIGLNAWVNQKGFRNDGSYYYGDVINNPKVEGEYVIQKQNIIFGITPAACLASYYSNNILPLQLLALKSFLQESKKRGIVVVGFISPYAPGVYNKILTFNNGCSEAATLLNKKVSEVFAGAGAKFVNVSDVKKIGGNDTEFFDSGHYSEKMSLRLLISLAHESLELKNYLDLPLLSSKLNFSSNNFTVFSQP